ncbi:MAG: peptidylprolyl isomerase [Ruminococcus sp.]|nr:peptidylprolyl isomerase [Ruminococcus sp.]
MLKMLALTTALTLTCGAFASCGNTHGKDESSAEDSSSAGSNTAASDTGSGEFKADLLPETEEDIPENSFIITLREDKAPISCDNFEELVSSGFYDGVIFHRVSAGFMAQGGDPEGTGMGGSGKNITGEFKSNGVENDLSHVRSIVSMARSTDMNSASSQFFICYSDEDTFLDGNYAAFGQVTQGMDVVDRFLNCDRVLNSGGELASPVEPITITSAKMIDPDANGHKRALFTMDFTERVFTEGEFVITLHADKAPITCENFESLVSSGFYDGLKFHSVIDNVMAQTGDPTGTGKGGSDTKIKGEFSENGVDNDLKHVRGTVSMARKSDPDSATSQFFICYDELKSMDGKNAAFGEVTEGMDVVDGFMTVCRGYTAQKSPDDPKILSVPGTPITIVKAEMIDPDENGNHRAKFTVTY